MELGATVLTLISDGIRDDAMTSVALFSAVFAMEYERPEDDEVFMVWVLLTSTMLEPGCIFFMNSTAVGNYEDFMVSDLIPGLRQQLGIENIGLFGKSSGGFGSYNLAVRNPGIVQGFCAHSMDCGFEYAYIQDMVLAMDQFRKAGGPSKWFQRFLASRNKTSSLNIRILNTIACSAFFSPNESSTEMGIDFPFDWDSGEFRKDVWAKWKQVDPAETVKDYLRQLETLNYVYMDCGTMDEFNLIWGNRYVNRVLVDGNIRHYYEEYEDGHFGIQYRFEKSLALMAASL